MDALIELFRTILNSESIKILGPAIIASYATYKATQGQIEIKLKELEKSQEFNARQTLFNYFRDRQTQLEIRFKEISNYFGSLVGAISGSIMESEDEDNVLFSLFTDWVEMLLRITPSDIDITIRDMKQSGLTTSENYIKLKDCLKNIENLDRDRSFQTSKKNMFSIMEAYHLLEKCNHKLLQTQMEKIFKKYIEE